MSQVVLLAGESTTVRVMHVEATEFELQKVIKCLITLLPAATWTPKPKLVGKGHGASDVYDFEVALKGPGTVDTARIRKELSAAGASGFTISVVPPKL